MPAISLLTGKCKDCAAAAASACEFTCKYCGNDYADAPNPTSFFVKKGGYREPPFGPVCNMQECRAEYNRRKSAAPDMEAKNARLQREKEKDAAQAKAEREQLEARLASAQQENDAFREAADSAESENQRLSRQIAEKGREFEERQKAERRDFEAKQRRDKAQHDAEKRALEAQRDRAQAQNAVSARSSLET